MERPLYRFFPESRSSESFCEALVYEEQKMRAEVSGLGSRVLGSHLNCERFQALFMIFLVTEVRLIHGIANHLTVRGMEKVLQ